MLFFVFSLSGPCRPYGSFWPILVYTITLESLDECEVILPNSWCNIFYCILTPKDLKIYRLKWHSVLFQILFNCFYEIMASMWNSSLELLGIFSSIIII